MFLGVDGGQSSTTAVIGDDSGRVLGVGRGGPCNHVAGPEGRTKFVNAISGCLREAGGQGMRFRAACLGFSGGPADKDALLREMIAADQMMVTHDGLIALSGATGGQPGVIVIAGTGSFAFGRNAAGETSRAGGWGYVFGDEGGGFDLTRQALRAGLRYEEGWGPPTALREMLLQATQAVDLNDLLHRFYTVEWPRPKIAAFGKLVDEAAQAGDGVAQKLLRDAAQELATFGSAVRLRLFGEKEPVPVAYVGGMFRSAILLERFRTVLELNEQVRVQAPAYGPAAGALIEAYRMAGIEHQITHFPENEK